MVTDIPLLFPVLNYQYQIMLQKNKKDFVNSLEFYIYDIIKDFKLWDTSTIRQILIEWILKTREKEGFIYEISNSKKQAFDLSNPDNDKEPDFLKLFMTPKHFNEFLTILEDMEIFDKSIGLKDSKVSKPIVEILKDSKFFYSDSKKEIAEAVIKFFNPHYSINSARKYDPNNSKQRHIYDSLKGKIKESNILMESTGIGQIHTS